MRRSWALLGLLAVTSAASTASCGWYTNAPAAVRLVSLDPATVDVKFQKDGPALFTNPKVVLGVENGSIGTTFTGMTISYIKFEGPKVGELTASGSSVTIRAEASTAKVTSGDRPAGQPLEMTGGTSAPATLPVVNGAVLKYAKDNNVGAFSAYVELAGMDDARFPSSLKFYVPITFTAAQ